MDQDAAVPTLPMPAVKPENRRQEKVEQLPPYNVVLLNDEDHSFEYVIAMLQELFAHPPERGMQLAKRVDEQGRAIVCTTHKEKAELKRDQIHAFGKDVTIASCEGGMSAVIEPAAG